MGRSYYVDDAVEKYFSKLIQQQKAYVTGLIIGQYSSQRDYVLLAAQTPHKEEQCEGLKRKPGLSKLEEIDEEWISMHASQVGRMLPGGLLVLGVFLITAPDLTKDAQSALRKLIFAVEKSSAKNRLWRYDDNDVSERVAIHICSGTRKITCRTFDVNDPKSTAKPADWKYQSTVLSWLTIECNMRVDVTIPLTSSSSSYQEQQKSTRVGLLKWAREMDEAVVLLNGQVKDKDGDLLEEHKKSSRFVNPSTSQIITANILTPSPLINDTRCTALVQVCKSSMSIRGIVKCRGYVHSNRPKVRDAVQAIKRDILNTVSGRCEILFEDIILNGPQNESENEICPLPQRVFVPISGSNLMLCDYVFGDETAEDLQNRFLEMLDQEVQPDVLDFSEEKNSRTQTEKKQEEDISHENNTTDDQPNTLKRNKQTSKLHQNMGMVTATAVAFIGALLSFYYLLE